MVNKLFLLLMLTAFYSVLAQAQQSETDREWNKPVEPFRIIGNIYYVGAAEVTSFLITTPEGHFLLDGGYAETTAQIKGNIAKLGFKLADVKILLNSQAHFDHAGGLAELKRSTKAKMLASAADKILLENGGVNDFHFKDTLPYEPVKVDKIFKDGERINLGGVSMKAVFTPGHTKGCTTWTLETRENGEKYKVVFVGSASVPGYQLIGNEKYPNIVSDYEKTFRRMKKLKTDVFLASHGSFFNLLEKAEEQKKGKSPNRFVDPQGYRDYIKNTEKAFRDKLKAQKESVK